MEKTKRQLRAEAVENLKANSDWAWHDLADFFMASGLMDSPYNTPYRELRAALIDLLEDDELPDGDALHLMRTKGFSDVLDALGIGRNAKSHCTTALKVLAGMVERDYVSREAYEDLRDEYVWTNTFLHRMGKKCGTKDVPSLKAYVEQLEAERDEWKAKAEQAMESYADAKSDRDAWIKKYKDAKHAMNAAAGKWARADAELRSNDGVTNLEWLYEHDRERILRNLAMEDDPCLICPEFLGGDELCMIEGECSKVLREWFMEPHVDANDVFSCESVVTPETVDANDANATCNDSGENVTHDSREKLEADVRRWFTGDYYDDYYSDADMCEIVSRWLDRQVAITERHWMEIVGASANCNLELTNQIAELQDQLESAHAKNRALKAHISKMQEGRHGWHIKAAKLQSQVDKLTAECGECVYKQEFASIDELQEKVDSLTQANGDLRDEWHRVCRERDELRRELTKSNRERERLRKSLGIAIDHAHDMIALVSVDTDEGLA